MSAHLSPSRATEPRRHEESIQECAPCVRDSVVRIVTVLWLWVGIAVPVAGAQQIVLDRIVARVGGVAITETDVRASAALGLINLPQGADIIADGTRAMIDRQLILQEVNRVAPSAPDEAAVDKAVAAMKERVGSQYESLTRSTGIDDQRLRVLARESLRIQAYLQQRFGTVAQAGLQDARDYYEKHPQEFTRDGKVLPFSQVETAARTAASEERRRASIADWMLGLRARGDVAEVKRP